MYLLNKIDERQRRLYGWSVFIIAILLTLPWLGLGHFYTRGEPREALVAVAMMDQGNYILPMFQGEIAFKPPMLHWLVALFSMPAGHATEYTARIPSAIASIVMVIGFFSFYSKRTDPLKAFIASMMLMSCFEVHRAAMTCRVDMVLMAFTVGAIILLYRWSERRYKGLPIAASLLASGAILTKGPIGAILPCFIMCAYMAITGENWKSIIVAILKTAIIAAIIPAIWYIAAYNQGGDKFIELVMEENFGRFLGKMSYESHENGPFYYIPILLSGMLPWTLLALLGLLTARFSKVMLRAKWWKAAWNQFRSMDRVRLYAWIAVICIFVFYEIPKSKRSVYLLPMYPFMCLLLADYFILLYRRKRRLLKIFAIIIGVIGIIYSSALFAIHGVDLGLLGSSRGAMKIIMQMAGLQSMPIDFQYVALAVLPCLISVWMFVKLRQKRALLLLPLFAWVSMLFALDGLINPSIKNGVPDYKFAQQAKELAPDGRIYYYCPSRDVREEPIYTVTFYLDDKVIPYHNGDVIPRQGYIMMKEWNIGDMLSKFDKDYNLKEVLRSDNEFTSFRGYMYLYEFKKSK